MLGIVIANTGSPASADPDAIEEYLRDYLMDEHIRQLPKPAWKWLVYRHILPKRKHLSAERYRFIWTDKGSPLVANQEALARKIQLLFDAAGFGQKVKVRSAMSYGEPSLAHVLSDLRAAGADRIVLLPLYPQSAYSPTLAVVDAFWRAQKAVGWEPESLVIDNYHDNQGYINAIVRSIQDVGYNAKAGDRLLLSFHAIPLKDEAAGDTYREQIKESVALFAAGLGVAPEQISVGFQSVFGHDESKWVSPLSRDILKAWQDEDFRVVFACPGFSIDCLETLYDIPHEIVPALEGEGAVPVVSHVGSNIQSACNTSGRFVWVPTLNTSDEHARLIRDILVKEIDAKGWM